MRSALGVNKEAIPYWSGSDYDTVYVLTFDSNAKLLGFQVEKQNYHPCSTSSAYKPCPADDAVSPTPLLEDKAADSWPPHGGGGSANAEEARWLVHEADWGYLSSLDLQKQTPTAQVASYSDGAVGASTGRIFLYLMTEDPGESDEPPESKPFAAALTLSQAILDPADYEKSQCGATKGTDPEDPRCAKLTLSGMVVPSKGADIATGKAALFARHPQMQTWPADHGFGVFELHVTDVWMIANYGGGSAVTPAAYYKAQPKHHQALDTQLAAAAHPEEVAITAPPPAWNQTAARARWLVYNSLWTAISTQSVRLKGAPWGNVRSIADGVGANSTGLPFFYLPTPDPSAVDIRRDPRVTVSLSEAALGERVVNGGICGGPGSPGSPGSGGEAEDPTCGRIHLNGRAVPIHTSQIGAAEAALKVRHPNAPWLAAGGAHTGGTYYTISIESIDFLDMYGGPAPITVAEYLAAPSPGDQ